MAIKKGHKEIFQQDITDVLDKQLFESMGLLMTEEEQRMYERKVPIEDKRLLAVHEAGHMLLAHLLPQFDWHAFTYLLPGGKGTAWSLFYPREEMLFKGYPTVGYLKMQMVVAHGGRCAEQIVFGDDITDGGQDDLLKITRIARELVISPANPRLGLFPMTWSSTFEYPIPGEVELMKNEWEDPKKVTARMSVEVSELFTREVTRYIEETEEEAKVALMKNRHILDRLAAELFERTKLTGLEVEEIVSSMNPVMLDDPMKMPDMNLDTETKSPPNGHGFYEGLDIFPAPLHRC
uniref:Peptidase M41 domain-containing protein n=1 Tax=Araucaria cunninghamii TaxID=56994 RepID=A0A0D6QWL1_ARACU